MSNDPRQDHHSEADTETDPLTECQSNTLQKQAPHRTDSTVGPSGDYQFSVQPIYTLRSVVTGSSRKSSGDSMDEELYGLNDDFMEKLNVVRRKLNLIEISDDDTRLESTAIGSKSSTVASGTEDTETLDPQVNTINKFYNIYQLNYINQNVDIPETNCSELDSYYEITETEIKKKGLRSWSVALDELNTIFEVSSNVERESSFSDYLQLTYNPPKKKICKRLHTPVLSPDSNNEHIDLPYSLRVGMDTDLFKSSSRHYIHSKCTQYCGSDTIDGGCSHSLVDLDRAIEGTQIELCTKSESDGDDSEKSHNSTKVYQDNHNPNNSELVTTYVNLMSDVEVNVYGAKSESDEDNSEKSHTSIKVYQDDHNPSTPELVTSYVHLMPEVEVKTYGSLSPPGCSNSSDKSSSDEDDPADLHPVESLKAPEFICNHMSKYRLNLRSTCSSSSSATLPLCQFKSATSYNLATETGASIEECGSKSILELPNVPLDTDITCSSHINSNITTIKRSKSFFIERIRSKLFNPLSRTKVSDSCILIKTLKSPTTANRKFRWGKRGRDAAESSDHADETSKDSFRRSHSKTSSLISSSISASISEETLVENLTISPLITASLDVPRMFVKKYKFPPIAYLSTCLGQVSQEKLEKILRDHQAKEPDKDDWWGNTSKLKNSDSCDSYRETALQMMQMNKHYVQDKEVKEKESEFLATNLNSRLACNIYNMRKSQAQNMEFYDQNIIQSEPECDEIIVQNQILSTVSRESQGPRVHFKDEDNLKRPSREDGVVSEAHEHSDTESDRDNTGSCLACACFKNMFVSRETQFFT